MRLPITALTIFAILVASCKPPAPTPPPAPSAATAPGTSPADDPVIDIPLKPIVRAQRLPADDPNIILDGPKMGVSIPIAGPESSLFSFSPGGKWLLYSTWEKALPSQIWAVETANPRNRRKIAEVDQYIYGFRCADPDAKSIFVEEKKADTPDGSTVADSRFWWFKDETKKAITGRWDPLNIDCQPNSLSPDGHFVVLTENLTKPDGRGGYSLLHMIDLETNVEKRGDVNMKWLDLVGWQGSGDEMRLAMLSGIPFEPPDGRDAFLLDPKTGTVESAMKRESFADLYPGVLVSPDGKTTASLVGKTKVEFRPTAQPDAVPQTFTFFPDDRKFANRQHLAWADGRYLIFQMGYEAVIDSQTQKMSYLNTDGVAKFTPDFSVAAVMNDSGLSLVPVTK
ncbi:MAG TPA: hypothetical protein VGN88_03550 [Phycisphaerae bacterium]